MVSGEIASVQMEITIIFIQDPSSCTLYYWQTHRSGFCKQCRAEMSDWWAFLIGKILSLQVTCTEPVAFVQYTVIIKYWSQYEFVLL